MCRNLTLFFDATEALNLLKVNTWLCCCMCVICDGSLWSFKYAHLSSVSLHGQYISPHHRVQRHTNTHTDSELCFCVGCDGVHGGVHWQIQNAVLIYMGITHSVLLTFLCLQSGFGLDRNWGKAFGFSPGICLKIWDTLRAKALK